MDPVLGGELGEGFLLLEQLQDNLGFEVRCVSLSHGRSLPKPGPFPCLNSWVHYNTPVVNDVIMVAQLLVRELRACDEITLTDRTGVSVAQSYSSTPHETHVV